MNLFFFRRNSLIKINFRILMKKMMKSPMMQRRRMKKRKNSIRKRTKKRKDPIRRRTKKMKDSIRKKRKLNKKQNTMNTMDQQTKRKES